MKLRTLLVALCLLAAPAAVSAHGGAPSVVTVTQQDFAQTFTDVNPCTGELDTISRSGNGVFHQTVWPDGHRVISGTLTATFTFDAFAPGALDYFAGRNTIRFGEIDLGRVESETFVFNATATASDGSMATFHTTVQIVLVGGTPTVQFGRFVCA